MVSVQTPLHRVSDCGHPPPLQLLFVHCPLVHWMPQPPQLSGSLDASTHAPPHWIRGATHTHRAPAQVSPPVQRMLHPPQLSESVCTSTHAPTQSAVGGGQLVAHDPAAQTSVGAHAFVQSPQCAGSFARLTQMPPQSV